MAVKNTASATLRQIITMLFDRALNEFQNLGKQPLISCFSSDCCSPDSNYLDSETTEMISKPVEPERDKSVVMQSNQRMPRNLSPCITDAHFLLQVSGSKSFNFLSCGFLFVRGASNSRLCFSSQDLCSLTGGDTPIWLPVQKVSKAFGFELIESLLSTHYALFMHVYELQLLLKVLSKS